MELRYIFLTVLLCVILGLVCINSETLKAYTGIIIFSIIGIGVGCSGLNLIFATIFKKPHILLIEQFMIHQKMNPAEISWNDFNGKSYIAAGVIFCVISMVSIAFAFLML